MAIRDRFSTGTQSDNNSDTAEGDGGDERESLLDKDFQRRDYNNTSSSETRQNALDKLTRIIGAPGSLVRRTHTDTRGRHVVKLSTERTGRQDMPTHEIAIVPVTGLDANQTDSSGICETVPNSQSSRMRILNNGPPNPSQKYAQVRGPFFEVQYKDTVDDYAEYKTRFHVRTAEEVGRFVKAIVADHR